MPRTFEVRQQFDVPSERVRAMLVDPAYIRWRATRTGALSVDVQVDADPGVDTLRITRVLPTDQAPSFARGLLGDSITVVEALAWPPVVAGAAEATMEASFGSLLRLTGTVSLRDSGAGSVAFTRATCKAAIPLVGGKVEALVEQQVTEYLTYEVQIAREWLADQSD